MALTTITGEIQAQPLNDNFSFLNEKIDNYEIFNVKDDEYGAVGDGATYDGAAIMAAATAAQTSTIGAGIIFLPPGNYLVSAGVTIPALSRFIGSGIGISTIISGAAINALILQSGASVENLTVDGNSQATGSGVLMDTANDCKVLNVESKNNGYHGIAITTGLKNVIQNNFTSGNGHRGILIDPDSAYNRIINHYSESDGLAGILIGHNSYRNSVIGATVVTPGDAGIWVHNASYNNILTNIRVVSPAGSAPGILLTANSYDNILTNIQVIDAYRGILLRGADVDAGYTSGNTRNNIISDFYLEGDATADSIGISFDVLSGSTIAQNNKIYNGRINNFYDALRDVTGAASLNQFADIDTENITNSVFRFGTDYGSSRVHNIKGYTPFGSLAGETAHPAVPATGVVVTNPFPFSCSIYISGLTGGVAIDGTNTNSTQHDNGNGTHTIGPGQTITLTYASGTPLWRWFGLM